MKKLLENVFYGLLIAISMVNWVLLILVTYLTIIIILPVELLYTAVSVDKAQDRTWGHYWENEWDIIKKVPSKILSALG